MNNLNKTIEEIQNKNIKSPIDAAQKILENLNGETPVNIVGLANLMGFKIFEIKELINQSSGAIVINTGLFEKYGSSKCIFLNKFINSGKKRFVIAHEIGHYLLEFNPKEDIHYQSFYNKKAEGEKEKNADEFAAELLMPSEEFILKYDNLKNKNTDLYKIREILMEHFNVSMKSIEKRIHEVGRESLYEWWYRGIN